MIKIPELQGYFGGKCGSGVYQQIINIIPPHHTLVVPFLGYCGITRNLLPCENWYLNDLDKSVIDSWQLYYFDHADKFAKNTTFLNWDWRKMLPNTMDQHEVVIYLDPPYKHSTRKSNNRYAFEMTDADHLCLLQTLKEFKKAKILLSCYDNELYFNALLHWNKIQFTAQTRGSAAIETVYFNYKEPTALHDYRYFGGNYKEREHYTIKSKHLIGKFERMTLVERNYFTEVLRNSKMI